MIDFPNEASEDISSLTMPDYEPLTQDAEEEPARTQECDYCGHFPCGCGG